jgi:hypothetical protein
MQICDSRLRRGRAQGYENNSIRVGTITRRRTRLALISGCHFCSWKKATCLRDSGCCSDSLDSPSSPLSSSPYFLESSPISVPSSMIIYRISCQPSSPQVPTSTSTSLNASLKTLKFVPSSKIAKQISSMPSTPFLPRPPKISLLKILATCSGGL